MEKEIQVTVGLAASILGVSINTVRKWDDQGLITSERTVGGHRRYSISELKAFRAKQKNKDKKNA